MECAGDLSCCCIGVDVVNIAFAVGANGGNDGDVTAVDGVYNGGSVDFGDVAYIAVITFQFFRLNHAAVNAAEANGFAPQLTNEANQIFVCFSSQYHLYHFRCFLVGVAQTVDEAGFDVQFFQHAADFRAAAVDEHHMDTNQRKKDDVAHNGFFQIGMNHGVAAVFDHNGFAVIFLNVRQGSRQDCCLHGIDVFHVVCPPIMCGSRR